MLQVKRLLWDFWNVKHIARHSVSQEEVESVCHGSPVILRGQQKRRLVLLGSTGEGRILAVVLEAKGKAVYYPVTAYPADAKDTKLYYTMRGGGRNEENKN